MKGRVLIEDLESSLACSPMMLATGNKFNIKALLRLKTEVV